MRKMFLNIIIVIITLSPLTNSENFDYQVITPQFNPIDCERGGCDKLTLSLTFDHGIVHSFLLTENANLIPEKFKHDLSMKSANHGKFYLQESEDFAAFKIADGQVNGMFSANDKLYEIQHNSTQNIHRLYASDVLTAMESGSCHQNRTPAAQSQQFSTVLPQSTPRHIEVLMVNDAAVLRNFQNNAEHVKDWNAKLLDLMGAVFKKASITVSINGLEVWAQDQVLHGPSIEAMLGAFATHAATKYKPGYKYDVVLLMVGSPFGEGDTATGHAEVGTICTDSAAAIIQTKSGKTLRSLGEVMQSMAHEIGHTLGLTHRAQGCSCGTGSCLMDKGASGSTTFSDCDLTFLKQRRDSGQDHCLNHLPGERVPPPPPPTKPTQPTKPPPTQPPATTPQGSPGPPQPTEKSSVKPSAAPTSIPSDDSTSDGLSNADSDKEDPEGAEVTDKEDHTLRNVLIAVGVVSAILIFAVIAFFLMRKKKKVRRAPGRRVR